MNARVVFVAHAIPGRLRCRLAWLRGREEEATALADALVALPGTTEIQVRPYTGSVLVHYDQDQIDERVILDEIKRRTGVSLVLRPGEPCDEADREIERAVREARRAGPDVAQSVAGFFRGVSEDILRATEGQVDLGTLVALGFVAGGAAEIVATGELPVPQWFQLAWWAFRSFTTLETRAIKHVAAEAGDRPSMI